MWLRNRYLWDETVALEGRAGYYDRVGALKDMVQNHLLQLFCLVAMDPPVTAGERDLCDRKVDVRAIRPMPHLPFEEAGDPTPNVLRFGLDPETIGLELTGRGPGHTFRLSPMTLHVRLDPPALPVYESLLLDILNRNPAGLRIDTNVATRPPVATVIS
jgi:glucose-6-phosphate 1-dehydrogenase